MKKTIIAVIVIIAIAMATLTGCSAASKVNHNLSKQADYFECERRITVYNARTDTVIFVAEGYMSLSNSEEKELVATFKVGDDQFKKNYVYLNDYTLYVVEDISGTHTDPYHYKVFFHTDIVPDVEVRP